MTRANQPRWVRVKAVISRARSIPTTVPQRISSGRKARRSRSRDSDRPETKPGDGNMDALGRRAVGGVGVGRAGAGSHKGGRAALQKAPPRPCRTGFRTCPAGRSPPCLQSTPSRFFSPTSRETGGPIVVTSCWYHPAGRPISASATARPRARPTAPATGQLGRLLRTSAGTARAAGDSCPSAAATSPGAPPGSRARATSCRSVNAGPGGPSRATGVGPAITRASRAPASRRHSLHTPAASDMTASRRSRSAGPGRSGSHGSTTSSSRGGAASSYSRTVSRPRRAVAFQCTRRGASPGR